MFDLLIKNGRIIDGTGSPSYFADVAIKDGKIVKVKKGIRGDAKETIDAQGLVVTPGFIDSHAHNDSAIFTFPDQREKIEQGIPPLSQASAAPLRHPSAARCPRARSK
jgi:N-acyl-D-amino-acid deacylase